MPGPVVGKTALFWLSILVLAAILQGLLPPSHYSWATVYVLSVGIAYGMFRGVCVIINNTCVRILNKWDATDANS